MLPSNVVEPIALCIKQNTFSKQSTHEALVNSPKLSILVGLALKECQLRQRVVLRKLSKNKPKSWQTQVKTLD